MKRFIALLLAVVMCLTFGACGDDENNPNSANSNENSSNESNGEVGNNADNDETDNDWLIRGETINVARLRESVEFVELTTENWKDHFKVYYYSYSYDDEKIEYDAFGEVVSSEIITHSSEGYAFGAGNERYHGYVDAIIELKNKTTGELVVYDFNEDGTFYIGDKHLEEEFNLENYECTRIKGSIIYLNIPVGEIPVAIDLWPVFPEFGGLVQMKPGCLTIQRGTNAFSTTYVKEWFS